MAKKQKKSAGRAKAGTKAKTAAAKKQPTALACYMDHVAGSYGFARPLTATQETEDVFIPGRYLWGALPGDAVQVTLETKPRRAGTREGRVSAMPTGAGEITGVLEAGSGGTLYLRPDFCADLALLVRPDEDGPGPDGQKAAVALITRGNDYDRHVFGIRQLFGPADTAAACAQAVLHQNGIPTRFPDAVLAEAKELQRQAGAISALHPDCGAAQYPAAVLDGRQDYRALPIFTIDSASTKDIDDAIHISPWGDGWQLGVHIADVSHYVRPDAALDAEAMVRGTSVYYADSVVPMLPAQLSNDLCSLNAGVDRLAFSCIIHIDAAGAPVDYRFAKSVIRSRVKGVYSEVNQLLAGEGMPAIAEKYAAVADQLPWLAALHRARQAVGQAQGSMDIESDESLLEIDENGRCVGVHPRSRGLAEEIIEDCMVLANICAARFARAQGLPFVYRAHTPPMPDRVENLKTTLEALGVPYQFAAAIPTQPELSALLDAARNTPLQLPVHTAVLRAMTKADYRTEAVGHFSMALEDYAHFTSPIRRYPDLAIHRIMGAALAQGTGAAAARYADFAQQAALTASARELAAMAAERDCEDCYKAEYMRGRIGAQLEGVITGVTDFGVYVLVEETVEGLVRTEALCAGKPQLIQGVALYDARTGGRWAIGQSMRVQVAGANVARGQVDLIPAPTQAPPDKQRGKTAADRREKPAAGKNTAAAQKVKTDKKAKGAAVFAGGKTAKKPAAQKAGRKK